MKNTEIESSNAGTQSSKASVKAKNTKFELNSTHFELIAGLVLVVLAVATRFFPHPANFSPVLGIALFSGSIFKNKRLAYLIPIVALFASDLILGTYEGIGFVYLAYALAITIGLFMKSRQSLHIVLGGTLASALFFLVSNFGVWFSTGMYAKTFAGLTQCYVMALPFFNNTLISTLFYSFVLFISMRSVVALLPSAKTSA